MGYRNVYTNILSPETREARGHDKALESSVRSAKTWAKEAEAYTNMMQEASLSDEDVIGSVVSSIMRVNPGIPQDELDTLVDSRIPNSLMDRDRMKAFVDESDVESKLDEARERGAGYLPPSMTGEGEIDRSSPTWSGRLLDTVTAPARFIEAGLGGGLGEARRQTAQDPREQRSARPQREFAFQFLTRRDRLEVSADDAGAIVADRAFEE